jgi:hypothetical protein
MMPVTTDTVTKGTVMVRATSEHRKRRFKAAIELADTTIKAWADEAGISTTHLYETLDGKRVSAPLNERIDAFIGKHLPATARVA